MVLVRLCVVSMPLMYSAYFPCTSHFIPSHLFGNNHHSTGSLLSFLCECVGSIWSAIHPQAFTRA